MAFQADKHPGAWFDVERARKALRAIGAFKHTKGRWAGVSMRLGEGLDPWQVVWVLAPIFGWVYHDAEIDRVVRVVRSAWIEVPRKNGKSTFASGISGVLLLADGEAGAEVYNAAGSTLQAGRVFDDAKRMLMTSPAARKRVEPLKEVVRVPATGGILRVLSRVAETAHGLNVSGAIIDEVHTLRLRRALVEAIETGVGARDQPLIIYITTADEAEEGTIYDEKHNYTRNVANGIVDDPGHYGAIWAADKHDDPFAESTWAKANPGLGKSPTLAYMRREAKKAQSTPDLPADVPAAVAESPRARAGQVAGPRRSGTPSTARSTGPRFAVVARGAAWTSLRSPTSPRGPCGSSRTGLAPSWTCWPASGFPRTASKTSSASCWSRSLSWISDGWVETTEGDVIDYGAIKAAVIGDCNHFDMQRVSYDRMFAGQMVQELDTETRGVQIVARGSDLLGPVAGVQGDGTAARCGRRSATAATRSCGGWRRSSRSAMTAPTTSAPSSQTASSPAPESTASRPRLLRSTASCAPKRSRPTAQ